MIAPAIFFGVFLGIYQTAWSFLRTDQFSEIIVLFHSVTLQSLYLQLINQKYPTD